MIYGGESSLEQEMRSLGSRDMISANLGSFPPAPESFFTAGP